MELTWMLNHELALAERYRRFVTLLMLRPTGQKRQFRDRLEGSVRQSDLIFDVSDSVFAVLMSETDSDGARVALRRYIRDCAAGDALAYGIGSYPEDGADVVTLLANATKRLNDCARMPGVQIQSAGNREEGAGVRIRTDRERGRMSAEG